MRGVGEWLRADEEYALTSFSSSHASPFRAVPSTHQALAARPPDILAQTILNGLEDAKAVDIVSIDLTDKTSLADTMLIVSGRSSTHVRAIADRVAKVCRDAGFPNPKIEGMPLCDWVLLDARDVIVHVFRPDIRLFYNLEKMWSADRPGEASRV